MGKSAETPTSGEARLRSPFLQQGERKQGRIWVSAITFSYLFEAQLNIYKWLTLGNLFHFFMLRFSHEVGIIRVLTSECCYEA